MKTKLLKLVRKEAKSVIFDMDSSNTLYGFLLASGLRAWKENNTIEDAVSEKRRLRREHCIKRIERLRADRLFRLIWVLKNSF